MNVEQKPAAKAAIFLGIGVEKLGFGILLAVHEEALGPDVLEDFDPRAACVFEQQKIDVSRSHEVR